MKNKYFLDHLCKTIDLYNRKYDNVVNMGDFNLEPPTELIESLCSRSFQSGQGVCIDPVMTDQPNLVLDSGTRASLDFFCHHQITYFKVYFNISPPLPFENIH